MRFLSFFGQGQAARASRDCADERIEGERHQQGPTASSVVAMGR